MRILEVIEFFTPYRGGSVNVVYNISKHLAKRGHDVTIYTTDYDLDDEYVSSLKTVTVLPFRCNRNLSGFYLSPEMKKQIKNDIKKFDIIHLHNYRTYQNNVVSHYAKKREVPYVLSAHGSLPRVEKRQWLKYLFDIVFGHKILNNANKLIALTASEAEQYLEFGVDKGKIAIIPNGVDIPNERSFPVKGTFKKKYLIDENEKLVLYVGRLSKRKGLDILLHSFSRALSQTNNALLVIIGPDDGYSSTLNTLIKDLNLEKKVKVLGFVPEEDKIAAFIDSNVVALTSRDEGLPITILEACAYGTPVVITEGCYMPCVDDYKAGFVVKDSSKEIANALLKILNNDAVRFKYGENAKKMVRKQFAWNEVVEKIEKMYEYEKQKRNRR